MAQLDNRYRAKARPSVRGFAWRWTLRSRNRRVIAHRARQRVPCCAHVAGLERPAGAAASRSPTSCGSTPKQRVRLLPVAPARRGYVPAGYGLFPHLNSSSRGGTCRLPPSRGGRPCWQRSRYRPSGARPGLRQLSGGERQRVALARALAREHRDCCSSTSRSAALGRKRHRIRVRDSSTTNC